MIGSALHVDANPSRFPGFAEGDEYSVPSGDPRARPGAGSSDRAPCGRHTPCAARIDLSPLGHSAIPAAAGVKFMMRSHQELAGGGRRVRQVPLTPEALLLRVSGLVYPHPLPAASPASPLNLRMQAYCRLVFGRRDTDEAKATNRNCASAATSKLVGWVDRTLYVLDVL